MNNKALDYAIMLALVVLVVLPVLVVQLNQVHKTFENKEVGRDAFALTQARTLGQTADAYVQLAGKNAGYRAIEELSRATYEGCSAALIDGITVQFWNTEKTLCVDQASVWKKYKELYAQELNKYALQGTMTANEKSSFVTLLRPENYVITAVQQGSVLRTQGIAVQPVEIPVLTTTVQPTHVLDLSFTKVELFLPSVSFPFTWSFAPDSTTQRIGIYYFKPSFSAELQYSLEPFLGMIPAANKILAACFDKPSTECVQQHTPVGWTVGFAKDAAIFFVPLEPTQVSVKQLFVVFGLRMNRLDGSGLKNVFEKMQDKKYYCKESMTCAQYVKEQDCRADVCHKQKIERVSGLLAEFGFGDEIATRCAWKKNKCSTILETVSNS